MRRRPLCVSVLLFVLASASSLAGRAQDASARAAGTRNAVVGRVTNASGQPVPGTVVTLVERDMTHGVARVHLADARLHVMTDEHGDYRIDEARLGEFYVVAIPRNPPLTADRRVNRSGYAITYYPSARRAADAMPVTVNVRDAQRADITLVAAPLSVVSGTAIASAGKPVSGGILHMHTATTCSVSTPGACRSVPTDRFSSPRCRPARISCSSARVRGRRRAGRRRSFRARRSWSTAMIWPACGSCRST